MYQGDVSVHIRTESFIYKYGEWKRWNKKDVVSLTKGKITLRDHLRMMVEEAMGELMQITSLSQISLNS